MRKARIFGLFGVLALVLGLTYTGRASAASSADMMIDDGHAATSSRIGGAEALRRPSPPRGASCQRRA